MSDDYNINPARFELARQEAIARSKQQWNSWNVNMWKTYNTQLNSNWVDPWFEYESHLITNESPDWQITQNMYYVYCWLRYKGYADYAIIGLISTMIHESTIAGASWEGGHYPFESLIGYNAEDTVHEQGAYYDNHWSVAGTPPAYSNGTLKTWRTSWTTPAGVDYGPYTGRTWYKSAVAGSWDAVKEWPILTSRQMVPDVGSRIMPVGWETDELQFDRTVWKPDGRGYGLVQWTPWVKLPRLAAHFGSDAPKHWQLNGTLQLMILEYQRELTAAGDSVNGEWTSSEAVTAGFMITSSGYYFSYGQSCTWEQFAADAFIPWVEQTCANAVPPITDPDQIDWAKRMTAMTIWVNCYEHAGNNPYDYFGYNFPVITNYVKAAIQYWDVIGWDVKDIPRPRDIADCELDQYHTNPNQFSAVIGRRRKKKNVRAILF